MDGLASESETKQELDTSLVAPASPAPMPATPATKQELDTTTASL